MEFTHLQGLIAAPFTPMHADGSIHLELIPDYYALLKANGVTGAFICGSTGEGVSLTLQEKKAVAEAWAACSKNDPAFSVMPLLGGTCIADAKELAKHAQEIGLDAVSFTAPSYFKPANVQSYTGVNWRRLSYVRFITSNRWIDSQLCRSEIYP